MTQCTPRCCQHSVASPFQDDLGPHAHSGAITQLCWDTHTVCHACAMLCCAAFCLQARKAATESEVVAAREAVESGEGFGGRDRPTVTCQCEVHVTSSGRQCGTPPQQASAIVDMLCHNPTPLWMLLCRSAVRGVFSRAQQGDAAGRAEQRHGSPALCTQQVRHSAHKVGGVSGCVCAVSVGQRIMQQASQAMSLDSRGPAHLLPGVQPQLSDVALETLSRSECSDLPSGTPWIEDQLWSSYSQSNWRVLRFGSPEPYAPHLPMLCHAAPCTLHLPQD
jgi:hypothetical protein